MSDELDDLVDQAERDVAEDEAQREMPDHNTTPARIGTSLGYSFQLCLTTDLPEHSPGHGVVHYLRGTASGRVRYWRVVPDEGQELPTLGYSELAMHCRVAGQPVAFVAIRLMNAPDGSPLKSSYGYAVKPDGSWLDGVISCTTGVISIS